MHFLQVLLFDNNLFIIELIPDHPISKEYWVKNIIILISSFRLYLPTYNFVPSEFRNYVYRVLYELSFVFLYFLA
jgi:hypothetical protein